MTTIHPTKTCFDDAVAIIAEIVKHFPDTLTTDEFVIVHAVVEPYGEESAHAWVEDTKRARVIFMGLVDGKRETFVAPREEYYAELKVKEATRYTIREAIEIEKQTGRMGPWDDRYQKLIKEKT